MASTLPVTPVEVSPALATHQTRFTKPSGLSSSTLGRRECTAPDGSKFWVTDQWAESHTHHGLILPPWSWKTAAGTIQGTASLQPTKPSNFPRLIEALWSFDRDCELLSVIADRVFDKEMNRLAETLEQWHISAPAAPPTYPRSRWVPLDRPNT